VEDFAPGCLKDSGHFLPREPFRPRSQKLHVGVRQRVFSLTPRNRFHSNPAPLAVHPAQGIHEKYPNAPQRNEFELSRAQRVVPWPSSTATRANWPAVGSRCDFYNESHGFIRFQPADVSVNKGLELLHPIQNSLQLHPDSFSRAWNSACQSYPIQDWRQDALPESFLHTVAHKLLFCCYWLSLILKRKKNSIGPVEMWKRPDAFCRGFSTFP
jgi:hypothetical protein